MIIVEVVDYLHLFDELHRVTLLQNLPLMKVWDQRCLYVVAIRRHVFELVDTLLLVRLLRIARLVLESLKVCHNYAWMIVLVREVLEA